MAASEGDRAIRKASLRSPRRSAAPLTLLGLCLLVSGCSKEIGLLGAAGPVAEAQRDHLFNISLWMIPVVLPIFIVIPIILWRFRQGSTRDNYRPEWEFNLPLELAVWGLPMAIVAVLGYLLWTESYAQDPYRPIESDKPALEIQAIGLDWKWVFVYPEGGVASVNEVVFPADRPVRFLVTSGTVLQSFMIPELAGQIYAMPRMVTEINLQAHAPGEFRGLNTQYNGEGFAKQKFTARAVTEEEYRSWLQDTAANAPPLDSAALEQLKMQSVLPEPLHFGSYSGDPMAQLAFALDDDDPLYLVRGAICGR